MSENFEIDTVDKAILDALLDDARRPFSDIAKEVGVSDGTVHVRVNRLKEAGILLGSTAVLDYERLGYGVSAYIGINLSHAKNFQAVLRKMKKLTPITEAVYSTGEYSIFAKVMSKSIKDLHLFLAEKLQGIEGVQSTETIIVLETSFSRSIRL